jgi:glycosyltransferase involved in cell wall biosynthesis
MAQDPLHLLCIEPSFPGRLGAVADWLVRRRGYRCQFYCNSAEAKEHWPSAVGQGLDLIPFKVGGVARERAVPWTRQLERGLCYAYGCWEVLDTRRPRPIDLILGHSAGRGSTLFAPVSLPGVPVVNLFDSFTHAHVHDLAEEMGADAPAAYFQWRRSGNAIDLLDLENGVTAWTPTRWQRDLYPPEYRADFLVLYDGVDTAKFARRTSNARTIAGRAIPAETRVVSFVARYLDRLRGFDRFLALANCLLKARPDVLCVVVGDAVIHRSLEIQFYDQDYRAQLLARTPLHDASRLWFLDVVPQETVAELLAASDVHVYASRPYVVSRSLLEAMSAGAIILAWDTPPVREFLTHDQNGLLAKPDDLGAAQRLALAVLADREAYRPLGDAAARLIREHYAQDVTLPALAAQFDRLVGKGR